MKVMCDSTYALYLKNRYKWELEIAWVDGVMTIDQLTVMMAGICEE
jgi:hypothetical protein